MTDIPSGGLGPPPRTSATGLSGFLPQRSFGLKLLLVCALALLMAIPALFVFTVVYDRSSRAENAMQDVGALYGGEQTLMGPALSVPYSITVPDGDDDTKTVYGIAIAYAETGSLELSTATEEKRRGIHIVPIYTAEAHYDATFEPDRLRRELPQGATVYWDEARISLGLSNLRGTVRATNMTVNGERFEVEPESGSQSGHGEHQGLQRLPDSYLNLVSGRYPDLSTAVSPLRIQADMSFTGARVLSFGPFARDTTIQVRSDWEDPSFGGGFRTTSYTNPEGPDGFEAEWVIPFEARGIPAAGRNLFLGDVTAYDTAVTVTLIKTTSPYQSVQRALKYALMFIGFVFLAYFLFEVTSGQRAHPAQYILVGLAQSVFYLMLLALSEQVGFDGAFAIAAVMTVLLTAGYAATVFKSRGYGLRALGILTGVYSLIYILMRMEDYALLVGALASFCAIALTMWMTRNIDWYGARRSDPTLPA